MGGKLKSGRHILTHGDMDLLTEQTKIPQLAVFLKPLDRVSLQPVLQPSLLSEDISVQKCKQMQKHVRDYKVLMCLIDQLADVN